MKGFLLVLAVFVSASSAASTKDVQARWIEGIVETQIEELRQSIRDAGLDPFNFSESFYFKVPVTDFLEVQAAIEDFVVEGLSNIVINNIDFSILASRVRYDVALPLISARIGNSGGSLTLGHRYGSAAVSGDVEIVNIRVTGEVRLYLGIISGVSVTSITVNFSIDDINSNLSVELFDRDLSAFVNNAIGSAIPAFLEENRNDINTLLAHYALQAAQSALNFA